MYGYHFGVIENGFIKTCPYVYFKCGKRFDEYRTAAGVRCGDDNDYTEEILPENKRSEVFFIIAYYDLILVLILFLAGVNFVASAFDA